MNNSSSTKYEWKKEYLEKSIDELSSIKSNLDELNQKNTDSIESLGVSNDNDLSNKLLFIENLIDYMNRYSNSSIEELQKMIIETEELMKKDNNEHIDVIDNGLDNNLELLYSVLKKIIREKQNNSHEEINKNDMPILKSSEEILEASDNVKYADKISKLLDIPISKCKEYSRTVDNMEATFYYNPIRGGKSMIVSNDGSYLLTVSSTISYDKLLEEFKTGRRNGNFENDSLFKIVCHGCGKELEIDISKLPENMKTLDTMCPNCKSFVKFGNPNFKEQSNSSDFSKINNVKELKNIIDNIFRGLTGDVKKDTDYLNKKMSEYKEHPLEKEISKEIGRKLYEIMLDENKNEISNAYNCDIENINKMLKEVSLYIFGKNKNLEKAKNILLDFVKGSSLFENDLTTDYYNFNDVIDFALYTRINKPTKDIKWLDIPFATAYSYLSYIYNEERNYDEALKMIDQTIKWAPMSLGSLFEKCETYKMQKDWEEFNKFTLSLYDKIYNALDLAHYYRNLGYYYIEINKLDIAYALYTASLKFEKNQHAMEEMNYINQQLGRDKYDMSADEGLKLMKEINVPFGPKQENLNVLTDLYTQEKEIVKNVNFESLLANRIYQLTKDKRFSPFKELVDSATKCSIIIPRSWRPVKEEIRKGQFGNRNMFAVYTDNNSIFQANYDGKCPDNQFNDAYQANINNMINNKKFNLKLLDEGTLTLRLPQGNKDFKHALFDMTLNNKVVRMIHYFTLINGIFADFSINLDEKIDYNDKEKFNNQKNMRDIINLLLNIIELKDKSNIKTNPMDNLLNNIDNKIIELTNQEFEEIYINYQNNKNLNRANEYIDSIFKNKKVDDPFWLTIAKNILLIIIVNIMEEKKKLIYDDFKTVLNDKKLVFDVCKNGVSLKENAEYEKIKGNINSSGDKIIESGYELLLETVGIIKPSNRQLVHKITFNNGLSFNITFDKELGELQHPNETTFRIGNNISILLAKCSSDDLLETRANEWLINSAKTNKQVIDEKYDKKYSLKKEQINVIEKGVIKENKKARHYKFIYFNQSMIIFGYNDDDDLSSIIDTAIESIKFVKDFVKVERNPFEKPNIQNNYLKREIIIKLNDDFKNSISNYDSFDIPNELYLDYFKKLEDVFTKHTYRVDKRFVTYGRLDFLRKELTERLNDKNLSNKNLSFKNQWDNRQGAFWDLSDYIIGDRHINVSSVPSGMNHLEIIKLNDEYYNEAIICKQEKDIILEMINEIKTFIVTGIEKVDNMATNVKESLNMFKLKDREFSVKNSNMNINKMNDKYYIFPEISMEEKKYDGEYWSPQLYVNNGIEINLDVLKNDEIVLDYDSSINSDECWTLYVFEHEDVLKSQIVLKRLDENLYNMTWNGTANVNWNDEFGSNVPFECNCNISISNYDKYIN